MKILDNITITDEALLTVSPGTKVEFGGFYHIKVEGAIQANGEAENRVIFSSHNPQDFSIDYATSGAWNGIKFTNTSALNPVSKFEYCNFEYSKSFGDTAKGGVISAYGYSNLRLVNSEFSNNLADYGGAISLEYQSSPTIFGCLFKNNHAFINGSPIYCSYSFPKITNSTIVNNTVLYDDIYYKTGAIYTFISKPKITNNIFWNNISNYFTEEQLIECKGYYTTYNDIQNGHPGKGNIDLDPLFIISGEIPFSLTDASPCIDAGSPDTTTIFISGSDLEGNPRVFQNKIDMGAYEWHDSIGVDTGYSNPLSEAICYPNPCHGLAKFEFKLNKNILKQNKIESGVLSIYNIKGRKITTVKALKEKNMLGSENFYAEWDGTNSRGISVQTGIYFYQFEINDKIYAQSKLVWIR
ncbi:MAG: T9SS type A sorting domain-containing protein [Candidatus Cloacimonetes bacterium]|nr:T9SS type A sorting domain-containing protein [Candidatus Cloacimonadota bacterium]